MGGHNRGIGVCSPGNTNIFLLYTVSRPTSGSNVIQKTYKGLLKYDNIHQTQLIFSLTVIRLATCFDPAGSSSGLHYEPIDIRKLRTFLGSQTMVTKDKYETLFGIPRMYAAF